jgi:hypothetical protein
MGLYEREQVAHGFVAQVPPQPTGDRTKVSREAPGGRPGCTHTQRGVDELSFPVKEAGVFPWRDTGFATPEKVKAVEVRAVATPEAPLLDWKLKVPYEARLLIALKKRDYLIHGLEREILAAQ